jgi:hypothetical protein
MVLARPIQVLWFVGAAVFILALFHSMGGADSEWYARVKASATTTSKTTPSSTGNERLGLKEHVELAEKIWAKTVEQRHTLLKQDWEDHSKMPL